MPSSDDKAKLEALSEKPYKDQAVWFLNAFWNSFGQKEAEKLWGYANLMIQLDTAKKAEGNALDEFMAHHFLEKNNETLTVHQMREQLRQVGIEKVKLVPFIHYLIFRFKVDWHELVNAPQGSQEEIAKAQALVKEATARLEEARQAATELKAQEDQFNRTTEQLTRKTEEGSVVQTNKAKAELAQHLASDPLPLRRAKITAEATAKKAQEALRKAEEFLEEAKKKGGAGQGSLWWIDRELHEAKAYMPTSKGGYDKKK